MLMTRLVLTAMALLAVASVANAGIVDPAMSSATLNGSPAILLVAPGGANSFVFPSNHTIDVYVNDSGGNPVEIVATDIWLDNIASAPCAGGWVADSSTYAPDPGHTTFTGTPRGGVPGAANCRDATTDVLAVGQVIETLNLRFVTPDLNGDGLASLPDFAIFASFFNQPCNDNRWCGNMDKSGENEPLACVTLPDFAIFASYFNNSNCP